jgi:translation elongation factor EF-Ts
VTRDEVPADEVAAERVVLEQKYVKDEKQTIAKLLDAAGATLVRFEQIVIGG